MMYFGSKLDMSVLSGIQIYKVFWHHSEILLNLIKALFIIFFFMNSDLLQLDIEKEKKHTNKTKHMNGYLNIKLVLLCQD